MGRGRPRCTRWAAPVVGVGGPDGFFRLEGPGVGNGPAGRDPDDPTNQNKALSLPGHGSRRPVFPPIATNSRELVERFALVRLRCDTGGETQPMMTGPAFGGEYAT